MTTYIRRKTITAIELVTVELDEEEVEDLDNQGELITGTPGVVSVETLKDEGTTYSAPTRVITPDALRQEAASSRDYLACQVGERQFIWGSNFRSMDAFRAAVARAERSA